MGFPAIVQDLRLQNQLRFEISKMKRFKGIVDPSQVFINIFPASSHKTTPFLLMQSRKNNFDNYTCSQYAVFHWHLPDHQSQGTHL